MKGSLDIVAIQRALPPLSEFFTRDSHELKRTNAGGTVHFTCCPFHQEKTPSCQINDEQGRYHCFGCGSRGDHFDYWQKSRGIGFRDALEELAALVGITPQSHPVSKSKAAPRPKVQEKPVEPLHGDKLAEWIRACETLAESPEKIQRIAEWRGIDPACVAFAAERGIMGLMRYFGSEREAFLVERPDVDGVLQPVSAHIRLGPETQGNPHPKASWRFTPAGVGSWPFLIGEPAVAKFIFVMEGQWDALALTSVMGWHRAEKWPDVAVIGLRGATGHNTFLKHAINTKACVVGIADADGAGAKWFEEGGLLDKLHTRARRVAGFWPTTAKADFNDLVKHHGLDRDTMLSLLQPILVNPHERPAGPTFTRWCRENQDRPDPVGRACRHHANDKTKPSGRRPLHVLERYWKRSGVPDELRIDLGITWNTYRKECRPSY